jgi:hypothetical protein
MSWLRTPNRYSKVTDEDLGHFSLGMKRKYRFMKDDERSFQNFEGYKVGRRSDENQGGVDADKFRNTCSLISGTTEVGCQTEHIEERQKPHGTMVAEILLSFLALVIDSFHNPSSSGYLFLCNFPSWQWPSYTTCSFRSQVWYDPAFSDLCIVFAFALRHHFLDWLAVV